MRTKVKLVEARSLNRLSCCIVRQIVLVDRKNKSVVQRPSDKHEVFPALSLFVGIIVTAEVSRL